MKLLLAAALLFTLFTCTFTMVYQGSTITSGPTFNYITKFAFDPGCQNDNTCLLVISWTANEDSEGVFAIYDDETWPTANSLSDCSAKYAAKGKGGVGIPFSISSQNQTVAVQENYEHWWYVALVNCTSGVNVDYTLTFLNHGSQFGFNEQGMLPLYVFFLIVQVIILIALILQNRFSFLAYRVTGFVSISILIECAGLLLSVLHWATYSSTGQGVVESGNWLEELATCVLLAGILHGAAGWNANSINTYGKRSNRIFVCIIATISTLYVILLIWAIVMRNSWWFVDYLYESAPGAILMTFRIFIGVWFLFQLNNTMKKESNSFKRAVYLQFGVVSFAWLWGIPVCAFIGFGVLSFYQLKVETALFLCCDTITYALLLFFLRPSVIEVYFSPSNNIDTHLTTNAPPSHLSEEFLASGDRDENQRL